MNFAHGTVETPVISPSLMDNAGFTIPFITLLTLAFLLVILWLLKRYTSWQFPTLNERKK